MSWACSLSHQAAKQFRALPRKRQEQLAQAIDEMGQDPALGDVRPIKSGKFRGALRKRVGPYRIIYSVDPRAKGVAMAAILTRGESDLPLAARGDGCRSCFFTWCRATSQQAATLR